MKWRKLILNASSWLLDTLIGLYVIILIAFLVLLFVGKLGGNGFFSLHLNEEFESLVDRPNIEPGPGMEGVFEVLEVEPIEHRVSLELNTIGQLGVVLPVLIYAGLYLYTIVLLSNIVRSVKANSFFIYKNVVRLRIIGIMVLLSQLVDWGSSYVKVWFFNRYLVSTDIVHVRSVFNLFPNIFSSPIIVGLLVLIIAEAFAHGLKLKEEQELTI